MIPPPQSAGTDRLIRAFASRNSVRVFVSFDFDRDQKRAWALTQQLKQTKFAVDDWSLKEAAPERSWTEKAR